MTGADQLVATVRRAGPSLRRIGLGVGLGSLPARLLRRRLFRIRRPDLEDIIDILEDEAIPSWLAGGWGVDALLGRETRPHSDVDLCVRAADFDGAVSALSRIGYRLTAPREAGGSAFPVRAVLRDQRGRTVDLLLTRSGADHAIDPETGLGLPLLDDEDVAIGRLGGRTAPCLSLALQLESHRGYSPARRDRLDMRRLAAAFDLELPPEYTVSRERRAVSGLRRRAARFRTTSALFVRVPAAQSVLDELGATDLGLPPHVTVLYPFLPPRSIGDGELADLRDLFAGIPSSTVTFDRLGDFGTGSLYLAPVDPTPFVAMTTAVVERWPDHPPYGGTEDPLVPHLTVPTPGLVLDQADRIADRFLPIRVRVTEVELAVRDPWSRWSTRARFPLEG